MRVLLLSNVPMIRELGAGRLQLEAAEELRRGGHDVETFDEHNAFRERERRRLRRFRSREFASRARAFIRENAWRFDVIDALEGNLPYPKHDLQFRGLLAVRSTGHYETYRAYREYERTRWPDRVPGTIVGQSLHRWWTSPRNDRACALSLEYADLIRIVNTDEQAQVTNRLGLGSKTLLLHDGLPDEHLVRLKDERETTQARLARSEVVFVGSWCLRKGSADWGQIIRTTRRLSPEARFLFLGTGVGESEVLRDLGMSPSDWIRVVPTFVSDELPHLVSGCTVGALPSYVEGYPLSVIELLASGIPVAVYDAPGSRDLMGPFPDLVVAAGDAGALAAALSQVLSLSVDENERLAKLCIERAFEHRLSEVVTRLADVYGKRSSGYALPHKGSAIGEAGSLS